MGLRDNLKAKLCARKLDDGDVVRVPNGNWPATNRSIGGKGAWGVYVGMSGKKAKVRPILADGSHGKAVLVDQVEHLDDVIAEEAIAYYKAARSS